MADIDFQPELDFQPEDQPQPEPAPDGFAETAADTAVGVGTGVSLDFDDEIAGGLGAISSFLTGDSKGYQQHRDEYRSRKDLAKERSPVANTLGQVGGGLALTAATGGLGAGAGAGATAGRLVAQGAAMGAAQGAGAASELEDVAGGAVKGAAIGAGTGAAAKGVGRLLGAGTGLARNYLAGPNASQGVQKLAKAAGAGAGGAAGGLVGAGAGGWLAGQAVQGAEPAIAQGLSKGLGYVSPVSLALQARGTNSAVSQALSRVATQPDPQLQAQEHYLESMTNPEYRKELIDE